MPNDVADSMASSPTSKPSPAASGEGASPQSGAGGQEVGGANAQEVGVAGDSSDEGGEEEEVLERVSDMEYSSEDTDEEVHNVIYGFHIIKGPLHLRI